MAFTRIPETNLAGTLGGIVGQVAGTVIGNTNLATEKLQSKLDKACEDISNGNQAGYSELEKLEKTIDTLEKNISTVEKTAAGLDKTLAAVKVPIVALKVAINIIKYLPLPQMWLVTSVSALQADIVQMMSELVAQIEQIVLTLTIIVKIILDLLKKLKDLLTKLRKVIDALRASLAIQENSGDDHDREILEELCIVGGDGHNIFGKLASSINGRLTDILWFGDYSLIDTGSIVVENQVKAAESGTVIKVSVGSVGNWITTVYTSSEVKPDKPTGQDLVPKGWSTKLLDDQQGWKSKGTVSGLTGKVISWTDPVRCRVSLEQAPILPETKEVHVFKLSATKFKLSNLNMEEANAVILKGPDEAYGLFGSLLQDLDKAPISDQLKEHLTVSINPQEDQSEPGNTEEWYMTRSGELYKMSLKASSVSPKIATLRYVEVTDSSGAVVYEGAQTFATDPKVLFEETRVRLTQLLG